MTPSTFSMIDLLMLIIMGISILIGIFRGATREILGIAGWVGAFIVVFHGLPLFRPLGHHYIKNQMIADAVVFGVLFVVSLGVFILISRPIAAGVKQSMFGGLDRSLGLVFGFIRGVFVLCLGYLAMSFFYLPTDMPQSITTARFFPWVSQCAHELQRFIPEDYLPSSLMQATTINPLDTQDLLESSLETVKALSTLKPTSFKQAPLIPEEKAGLETLIEDNETETQQ
ncbi:MAG: CvpA family protein [Alphaproteobacteria bacterium]|nr:CvpA family protein [Alphaproteobacteria bacterium]